MISGKQGMPLQTSGRRYLHIDTAFAYGNEKRIGEGIKHHAIECALKGEDNL